MNSDSIRYQVELARGSGEDADSGQVGRGNRVNGIIPLNRPVILLNKVGKLLRDEPELGRVIAMWKNVYVDKLNVRKMVDDFGYLSYTGRLEPKSINSIMILISVSRHFFYVTPHTHLSNACSI